MPSTPYLVLPEVSSERRLFIPFGFEQPSTLCSNLVKLAPNATLFHFGILSSTMHNAWVRTTCGRLKSDYRYSAAIVYNNYPWPFCDEKGPSAMDGKVQTAIETAAQAVLDARAQFATSSLRAVPSNFLIQDGAQGVVAPTGFLAQALDAGAFEMVFLGAVEQVQGGMADGGHVLRGVIGSHA